MLRDIRPRQRRKPDQNGVTSINRHSGKLVRLVAARFYVRREVFERLPRNARNLPTWVLQQLGGYPGYTGHHANIVLRAARDPKPTSQPSGMGTRRRPRRARP